MDRNRTRIEMMRITMRSLGTWVTVLMNFGRNGFLMAALNVDWRSHHVLGHGPRINHEPMHPAITRITKIMMSFLIHVPRWVFF